MRLSYRAHASSDLQPGSWTPAPVPDFVGLEERGQRLHVARVQILHLLPRRLPSPAPTHVPPRPSLPPGGERRAHHHGHGRGQGQEGEEREAPARGTGQLERARHPELEALEVVKGPVEVVFSEGVRGDNGAVVAEGELAESLSRQDHHQVPPSLSEDLLFLPPHVDERGEASLEYCIRRGGAGVHASDPEQDLLDQGNEEKDSGPEVEARAGVDPGEEAAAVRHGQEVVPGGNPVGMGGKNVLAVRIERHGGDDLALYRSSGRREDEGEDGHGKSRSTHPNCKYRQRKKGIIDF